MFKTEDFFACPICKSKFVNSSCELCNICFPKKAIPSVIFREMYPSEQSYEDAMRAIDFWGDSWEKYLKESEHECIYDLDTKDLETLADHSLTWCNSIKSLMSRYTILQYCQHDDLANSMWMKDQVVNILFSSPDGVFSAFNRETL